MSSNAVGEAGSASAVRPAKPTLVVVGSINLDVVVRTPRHPKPGETVLGSDVAEYPGGKGANQAVAAARAGGQVRMVGRIGGDERGRALRDGLAGEGIDVAGVGVCKHDPTGLALITVDESGENTIVVVSGANHKIRPVHIDDAAAGGAFAGASVLLAQLECPVDVVTAALRHARSAGVRTVLNAAPAAILDADVLDLVDVLVVNEHELAIVTGLTDFAEALKSATQRVPIVIVTLGSRGSVFTARGPSGSDGTFAVNGPTTVPAFEVVAVDTTAAGDAFCGAMAVSLADGSSIEAAVLRGNAAGALAATRPGAQPSLPTEDEISEMVAQRGPGNA